MKTKTAKIFTNGGSQTVRLPAAFRYQGEEVLVRRNEQTGEVILSPRTSWATWDDYLDGRNLGSYLPAEFMAERPLSTPLHAKSPVLP
jgi:antitoxin VapB